MNDHQFDSQSIEKKVEAGVWGWIAGITLGAPFQGRTEWRNLSFYTPVPTRMAPSEALDLAAIQLFAEEPYQTLSTRYVSQPGALSFAQSNLKIGFRPPLSGSFRNPLSRDASALGRAPLWGLIYSGRPGIAALMASEDAAIDHEEEAVWSAGFWAAAISAAPFLPSLSDCLKVATDAVPSNALLDSVVEAVLDSRAANGTWQDARDAVRRKSLGPDQQSAALAHGYSFLACAYGQADFTRSVCLAAGCGATAIEPAAVVGALIGAGYGDIPNDWKKPVEGDFAITAHTGITPPKSVSDFVKTIVGRMQQSLQEHPLTFEKVTSEPNTDDMNHSDLKPQVKLTTDRSKLVKEIEKGTSDFGWASVSYPKGPVAVSERGVEVVFNIRNESPSPIEITPTIKTLGNLKTAFKPQRLRIEPYNVVRVPAVVQATDQLKESAMIQLIESGRELNAPIVAPLLWWIAGPFPNQEQQGYSQEYRPETSIDREEVMSGRSAQSVRWTPVEFEDPQMDLEKFFGKAPGVIYLTTQIRFSKAEKLQMVLASPVGHILWINGEKKAWYLDTHIPVPRPVAPYVTEFVSDGWTSFLIKTLRDHPPVPSSTIYFLNEAGQIVWPEEYRFPSG